MTCSATPSTPRTPTDLPLQADELLSGVRRIGKTTFLKQDLIPALETDGAIVIYVDLWSETSVSPSALLQRAVRAKLGQSGMHD